MDDSTCSITDCQKPVRTNGWCYSHYMKAWRYGTPTPSHPPRHEDVTGKKFGLLVARERVLNRDIWMWLCDCQCGAKTIVRIGDLNSAKVISCGDKKAHYRRDDIEYGAAHCRVTSDRGRVSRYTCIDCGARARQWSYNHLDPNELRSTADATTGLPYSPDPSFYDARCIPCHKLFDLAHLASHG